MKWIIWWFKRKFVTPVGTGDNPDPRDYPAPKLRDFKFPPLVDLYVKAQRFFFEIMKQSPNACTAYMRIMLSEVVNSIQNEKKVDLSAELQWAHQIATGGNIETGDWIQNAFHQYHKHPQGYPDTEYRRIFDDDLNTLKKWLALGFPIGTGIYWKWNREHRRRNYDVMKDTGIYVGGSDKLGGHSVLILGFNDETRLIKCIESEKEQWGDNEPGVFFVPYDLVADFMSCYISFDAIDKIPAYALA